MASRDLQGSGRSIRLLSRDDRDRDDRDGRRDRDRRRREDRERRRDRETDNSKPVQGPIVLLKRPDAKSSSTSTSVSGDRVGEQSSSNTAINVDSSLKPPAGPTLILQRSSKQDVTGDQSGADVSILVMIKRGKLLIYVRWSTSAIVNIRLVWRVRNNNKFQKGKTSGPPALTDILRASYQFPGGRAMKLIDSNMKMCPWKNFDYDVNNYVGNTDYLVITAIGRPNVGKENTILESILEWPWIYLFRLIEFDLVDFSLLQENLLFYRTYPETTILEREIYFLHEVAKRNCIHQFIYRQTKWFLLSSVLCIIKLPRTIWFHM